MLEDETAGTPAAVNQMLAQLVPAVMANARKEAADMQKIIDQQASCRTTPSRSSSSPGTGLFTPNWSARRATTSTSPQVREYFELNRVLQDGLFYAAHELYGLTFKERHDLPVYNPDVRVFEVFNEDGSPLALFLADYFARDNKQGGAWMSEYVSQSKLLDHRPVVVNNLNVRKPPAGSPVLLTFDEVNTHVPRVRARPPWHVLERDLPAVRRHVRAGRLRGVPVAGQRNVVPRSRRCWPTSPGTTGPASRCRKRCSTRSWRPSSSTRASTHSNISRPRWWIRHGIKSRPARAPQAKRCDGVRGRRAEKGRRGFLCAVPPRYHTPYFAHIF